MQKVKWLFFGYIATVVLIVGGIAFSFLYVPARDPHTLYTTYGGSIRSLDPADVNDTVGAAFVGSIYECLYNYKYAVKPYTLFPELASEMPRISDGGKTLVIPLRRGIHFYDPEKYVWANGIGPEVKAADVIYSFKRIADFNLASPNYSQVFEGKIVGLDEWWDYTQHTKPENIDWDKPVAGFSALDDHTIQLKLTRPDPQIVYNLAHEPTSPVSREAVEKWGPKFRRHPVGTGPYVLREMLAEQRMILEANPIYRGRPDVDGDASVSEADRLPHIKRMEYDYFEEPVPVWLLFQQGLFDIAGIPKESFNQAVRVDTGGLTPALEKKGIRLTKSPLAVTEYVGFNMSDPIVGKNKPLRQAMSLAFDRETFIRNFENGRGQPAIGPIPPGFPTFDANRVNPYTQYNVPLAREKMKEAVRINGGPIPQLTYLMRDADTTSRQMADFFSGQMRQIGVEIQPEFRDWARWQEMVDNRQTQLFDGGWEADYPDEQNFLQLFFSDFASAGGVNSTVYMNPDFDGLYKQAAVVADSPQRREMYLTMQRIVEEDCPWLMEYYPVAYRLNYSWVHNLSDMDYGHGMRAYVILDESDRLSRLRHGR